MIIARTKAGLSRPTARQRALDEANGLGLRPRRYVPSPETEEERFLGYTA
jgi:hypothetical protein